MTLDQKFIQGELVRKTKELVGYRLYNYPPQPPNTDPSPAVFKSNAFEGSSPPSPKMPYIAIDFLQTLNPFHREKFEGWLNDTEYALLETKIMQYTVRVYGSGEDDTLSIASELASRLKMSKNRHWFNQFEIGLYDISNPRPSGIRLSDEYRDVTTFTISFSYVERVIDVDQGDYAIEQVNIDTYNPDNDPTPAGLDHFEDDPSPMRVETGDLPEQS